MVVGISKFWMGQDGWIYGTSVHVTSRINNPIRLIANCVLFVIKVSDESVIRQTTSVSLRDNYTDTGILQCASCQRWFRSREELAVHKCISDYHTCNGESESVAPQEVLCTGCQRSFRRPGDLKRHRCPLEREKPVHL